ncbi:MAG: hypothetical protein ACR2QF_09180 [Geminicoccaceae bacterium]
MNITVPKGCSVAPDFIRGQLAYRFTSQPGRTFIIKRLAHDRWRCWSSLEDMAIDKGAGGSGTLSQTMYLANRYAKIQEGLG